jgi:hypothetical protein
MHYLLLASTTTSSADIAKRILNPGVCVAACAAVVFAAFAVEWSALLSVTVLNPFQHGTAHM